MKNKNESIYITLSGPSFSLTCDWPLYSSSLSFPCSTSSSPLVLESVLLSSSSSSSSSRSSSIFPSSSSSLSSLSSSIFSSSSSSSQFWNKKNPNISVLKTQDSNKWLFSLKTCCFATRLASQNSHQSRHREALRHQRPPLPPTTLFRGKQTLYNTSRRKEEHKHEKDNLATTLAHGWMEDYCIHD